MALSESEKKQEKKERPPTKIVVRRLPPTIDQETFLKQVSPVPDYNYVYTVNGDSSLGEFAFSRVYFNFVNHEDVYNFKERFDNYVFLDSKGQEYPCVVEFASFQKIPKKRGKARMDPKAGTIESDPAFLEFVVSLEKTPEPEEKAEYTLQLTNENKNDVTTPLLEYLKNKRAQRLKIREVRREERKRREFDKRKERFDDRKKSTEEKLSSKEAKPRVKQESPRSEKVEDPGKAEEKSDKTLKNHEKHEKVSPKTDKEYDKSERVYEKSSYYKNKERKYEDRRHDDRRKEIKLRYPRKEYSDHKNDEHKVRDAGPSQKTDYRKEAEPKSNPKKVKKYSEKREERKIEAQKAEQKRIEQKNENKEDAPRSEGSPENKSDEKNQNSPELLPEKKSEDKILKVEEKIVTEAKTMKDVKEVPTPNAEKPKESSTGEKEGHNQRRIRNKDRPTIDIYRPGMLSRRKQNATETINENKDSKTEEKKSSKD